MSASKDLTAFPDGDNLFKWTGSIKGANDTVYEGLVYKLKIEFTSEYPYKGPSIPVSLSPRFRFLFLNSLSLAPQVRFETPCFHPNVDASGAICLGST